MARPKKEIDKAEFEKLCELQCTREEICSFFNVTEKTLNRWCKEIYGENFSLVFSEKKGMGKISLRRKQFQLAEKSTTMAIWLGKNWLGQTEEPREKIEMEIELLKAKIAQLETANQMTAEDKVAKLFEAIGGALSES